MVHTSANPPRGSEEVVVIVEEEERPVPVKQKRWRWSCPTASSAVPSVGAEDRRRLIHAAKVGLALVLVSLLYILEDVHDRLGDNAMWAIMTVVVVFELTSGATISKGVNRGIGTILGGGLGFLVALLAQQMGGIWKAVAISASCFVFGAAATYTRMIPKIKKKYDYGVLIFILTFSLVAVSGIRGDEIVKIASDRLSSICMGFAICIFINLFIFPVWAGDDLHKSLVSKFDKLALAFEECVEEHFIRQDEKKETGASRNSNFWSVLYSKTTDESLANFARWEPWHGKYGLYYPWNKYIKIGELLRELAVSVLSLRACLQSKQHQPSPLSSKPATKEQCEATCILLGTTLKELGENIKNMRRGQTQESIAVKLNSAKLELNSPMLSSELETLVNPNGIAMNGLSVTCFVFMLVGILGRVEELAKEVEELGSLAKFR